MDTIEGLLRRTEQERDLYLGLLDLNEETEPEVFLSRALTLIAGAVGAKQGYLELFDPRGGDASLCHSTGFSGAEVERIRTLVSRGVIAHAVATGSVVRTPSAFLDPRFRDRESVQKSKLDAVLCAPIGREPPIGVLYLQGQLLPDAFGDEAVARVERLSALLAPIASQRLREIPAPDSDPTEPYRRRLELHHLIGKSPALAALFGEIEACARLNVGVLITGETGTGKSLVARAIHENSPRASGPFVALNSAAIPEPLLESELFGAKKGAHSTADRDTEGKVEGAHRGTLFLDEIGELPVTAQAKLLSFLQTKEYFPLGSSRPKKADVRILAATNQDLDEAVRERRFREDLWFRLNVVSIRVPTLHERRADLAVLAHSFCEQAIQTHKLGQVELSPGALRAISLAEWRGNVRQLSHAVEAATIRAAAKGLDRIEADCLFRGEPPPGVREGASPENGHDTFQAETRRFQRELLMRALTAADWNVSAAAKRLDLTRGHVYALIKALDVVREL